MIANSKILININNLNDINEYKKIGINNFLFAVKDLSIGYTSYDLENIPTDSYLFINRVFDTEGINIFKSKLEQIKQYKGVIFEDLGVYHLLKDTGVELIWFQNHFTTNYQSMNYYLNNGCTSAVVSNEITLDEITEIANKAVKKVVINIFGKNQIMYSRRTLMTNFNKHNNLRDIKDAYIYEKISNNEFNIEENEYGTVVFNSTYFNYIKAVESLDDKVYLYLVMNKDYSVKEIEEILNGKEVGNDGFLNRKTVYRLADYK